MISIENITKEGQSNSPLLVDWQVTAGLEDVEVLFRKGRVVEGIVGSIFSRMCLQSRSCMSLEVREPSAGYRVTAVAIALVHVSEVRI